MSAGSLTYEQRQRIVRRRPAPSVEERVQDIERKLAGTRLDIEALADHRPAGWCRMSALAVGDRVRIERDEIEYPSKGTWPQFRGNTGTITQINGNGSEFGVVFGNVRKRPDGSLHGSDVVTWFKIYELTALAPRRDAERRSGRTESVGAR